MTESTRIRRLVGFWPRVWRTPLGQLLWPEGAAAIVLGGGGASLLVANTTIDDRLSLAADFLIVVGPLLGIVFAATALVATLMSDRYLSHLRGPSPSESSPGLIGFFSPFIVTIGLQVAAVLACLAYRAAAQHLPVGAESWLFTGTAFLVAFGVLEVVALGRTVLSHAYTRSLASEVDEIEAKVRDIRRRAE